MLLWKMVQKILLAVVGLAGGVAVAAGIFALITMIGIIPRVAARLKTAKQVYAYETIIALGGTVGSVFTIYPVHFPVGQAGMAVLGVFAGMFVGCLSMALAESLRVIPLFTKRLRLSTGFPYLIFALALGKGLGSLYQLFFH